MPSGRNEAESQVVSMEHVENDDDDFNMDNYPIIANINADGNNNYESPRQNEDDY